jgi:hypothetical protein
MGQKMPGILIRTFIFISIISMTLSMVSCSGPKPLKTVMLEKRGMAMQAELMKTDNKKSRISGNLKVYNTTKSIRKFSVPQLFLHDRNERYRTYIDAITAFMIDYGPVELGPRDTLKLSVLWAVSLPFDTSGLYLEYTDFLGVGRVHPTEQLINQPDSIKEIPGKPIEKQSTGDR